MNSDIDSGCKTHLRFVTVSRSRWPPPGGGSEKDHFRTKFSKNTKNCPNPIIIINIFVGDVPKSVRDVSEHDSDDLLWSWGHFLKTIFGGSARPKRDHPPPPRGRGGHRDRLTVTNLKQKSPFSLPLFFFSGDLTGDLTPSKKWKIWWPLVTSKNALFQEIWWPLVTSLKSKQKKFIRSIPQHGQKLSFQCPISFSSYFDVSELVSDIDLVLHSLL